MEPSESACGEGSGGSSFSRRRVACSYLYRGPGVCGVASEDVFPSPCCISSAGATVGGQSASYPFQLLERDGLSQCPPQDSASLLLHCESPFLYGASLAKVP